MTEAKGGPPRFSLRRWSQRKLAAARGDPRRDESGSERGSQAMPDPQRPVAETFSPESTGPSISRTTGGAPVADAPAATGAAQTHRVPRPGVASLPAASLPSVESLTIDSDFSPFMQPGVAEDLKRSALRKLMRDPRFNVMDGLDVYIDDYSVPSPLEPELARTLMQARYILDPPKTRIGAEGHVEDVPPEPVAVVADAAPPATAPVAGEIEFSGVDWLDAPDGAARDAEQQDAPLNESSDRRTRDAGDAAVNAVDKTR